MKLLICSGTLYSGWDQLINWASVSDEDSKQLQNQLSSLNGNMLEGSEKDTSWKPRAPNQNQQERAQAVIGSIKSGKKAVWPDVLSSLNLDFWQKAAPNSLGFLLFYSSPEHELSSYLADHPFTNESTEEVLRAWRIRMQAMLTFFMTKRANSLLINVESAIAHSTQFKKVLDDKFGCNLEPISLTKQAGDASLLYLASTVLLTNDMSAEIYDEVRSAATILCDQEKSITDITARNETYIKNFQTELLDNKRIYKLNGTQADNLSLNKLQTKQVEKELNYYFNQSRKQKDTIESMLNYNKSDPLLNVVRLIRKSK